MKKSERTRQFIIECTALVFNKRGYAGTSMSELTAATGLTKGAIYGNFENKDEVALLAFEYNLQRLQQQVVLHSQVAETSLEKLMAYVNFYQSIVDSVVFKGGCPLMNAAVDSDDMHPELFEKVKKALTGWRSSLISIIKKGISNGEINPGTNAESFADNFISLIEGGILLSKTLGSSRHLLSNLKLLKEQINNMGR
jgi:AcrR family transcriptional regulator